MAFQASAAVSPMPHRSRPAPTGPLAGTAQPERPTPVEGGLRFATSNGMWFTVREVPPVESAAADLFAGGVMKPPSRTPACLIFESDVITYRVYAYPADWATLPSEALVALAVDSRPAEPPGVGLAPPTVGGDGLVEFTDYTGQRWRVVEDTCGRIRDPLARARHCLVFTTALFVRRIYEYPPDWARMSSEALIALSAR